MPHASPTIGVWIPIDPTQPMAPPTERPMGRAALQARDAGLTVLFGDRWEGDQLSGVVATPCKPKEKTPESALSIAWMSLGSATS